MKTNLLFKSIFVLAISTLLASCSTSVNLSKKRYSNGYYVSITNNNSATQTASVPVKKYKNLNAASKTVKVQNTDMAAATVIAETIEQKNVVTQSVATQQTTVNETKSVVISSSKKETLKASKKATHFSKKENNKIDDHTLLLVIMCFIPILNIVAVGLKTDWATLPVVLSILFTCLAVLPGLIYSLLVVLDVI